MAFRVAYIVSHPIQYQAPLLRYLSHAGIDLHVFFLSDFSLREHYERPFKRSFKWDVPLTDGYRAEVLGRPFRSSKAPSRVRPIRRLTERLRTERFDALWVHGWGYLALCQCIHAAASAGLPVLVRGESLPSANPRTGVRGELRRFFYVQWLFKRVSA